jgi:hypothetical protein
MAMMVQQAGMTYVAELHCPQLVALYCQGIQDCSTHLQVMYKT